MSVVYGEFKVSDRVLERFSAAYDDWLHNSDDLHLGSVAKKYPIRTGGDSVVSVPYLCAGSGYDYMHLICGMLESACECARDLDRVLSPASCDKTIRAIRHFRKTGVVGDALATD